MDLEVLPPEFASFSSPKPLLLEANSFIEELEYALQFLNSSAQEGLQTQRYCLAICGYSQAAVERIGEQLALPVLSSEG